MIIRRLAEAIREQSWVTISIEFVIVVAGIFVGLQADGWNDARKDRIAERRYLERLYDDLAKDIDEMRYGAKLSLSRRDMGRLLLRAIDDPDIARSDPVAFITAIEQAGYTFLPSINDSTFEEIKFAGHLGIIQNEELRGAIAAYYKLIERYAQWSYLREDQQITYSRLSLGILNPDQQMAIPPVRRYNDTEITVTPPEFTVAEAVEALNRMRDRPEFLAHIPKASGKGLELGNIRTWLRAAEELHANIAEELKR